MLDTGACTVLLSDKSQKRYSVIDMCNQIMNGLTSSNSDAVVLKKVLAYENCILTFTVHILSGNGILDFTRKSIYRRIEALTHITV